MPEYSIWEKGEQARSWPGVKGQVVEVVSHDYAMARPHVRFHCLYRYEVEGKSYLSMQITPGSHEGEEARELKSGQTVDVYYNPDNPADAVLSRVSHPDSFGATLIVVIAISMLIGMAIVCIGK